MTDRVKGFTVTLVRDIRIDDVEPLMEAIQMLKGVMDVKPLISGGDDEVIKMRTTTEIRDKLYKFINDNL